MDLLKPLRQRFPMPPPSTVALLQQELAWQLVESNLVLVDPIASPRLSQNHAIGTPSAHATAVLDPPSVIETGIDHLDASIHIVDLLASLPRPEVNGTIFIKKEEEQLRLGQRETKTRIEPQGLQGRLDPKHPRGLDIFGMLLPILMPPARTEFRDELLFPGELYGYQRDGVKWLFENESALLADDMGLGKTVQAITAFRALIRRGLALQALVICPKSVLTNWMRELERWAPELVAVRVHGDQQARHIAWRAYVGKCHVLVTTYETVRQDRETIRGRTFDLVVADEVQRIKNPDADTSRAVRSLTAKRRWGLSGTPLENKLEDVVSVFGFIQPGLFQASEVPFLGAQALRERIRPYVLRRLKKDALPDLPETVDDTKWLDLTEAQRQAYNRAETQGVIRLRQTTDVTVVNVLALIQQLKQICNFDPETGESTKLEFLHEEFLEQACQDDGKALIISQYVKTLENLAGRLDEYKPHLYTGQLSTAQRDTIINEFQSDEAHRLLLLSLRAGGQGLNLTRANYALLFDRWWNPAVEDQAVARLIRIGQTKTVFVTRLMCRNTIEERIEQILNRKRLLFQEVVDELTDVSPEERVLSEEELFGLFGLTPPRRTSGRDQEPRKPAAGEPMNERQSTVLEIKPETPYSNVLSLRQTLRRCENYIWWADRYFRPQGLEEMLYCVDPALVREVRILSGPDTVNERAKGEFARFSEEMQRKGVITEWRVLKSFAHDRFIVTQGACFLVPSVDIIFRGQYSQIRETPIPPPFEDWWKEAVPLSQVSP